MNDKLTERIRKLLALSKSPNQHEAEAAMAKANQLMIENQISMSEVLIEDLKTSKVFEGDTVKVSETYRSFVRVIASAAGKVFDCKAIGTGEQSTFFFVGQTEDVKRSEILFDYLFESWKSIVAVDTADWKKEFYYPPRQYEVKQYKISHGQGFSAAIMQRANALVTARKTAVEATGTSLIVLKNQVVKEYIDKHTKPSRSSYKAQEGGFSEGYAAGKQIPLTTGIDTAKKAGEIS